MYNKFNNSEEKILEANRKIYDDAQKEIALEKARLDNEKDAMYDEYYNAYMEDTRYSTNVEMYNTVKEKIYSEILETVLCTLLEGCFSDNILKVDNTSAFNKSIVANYVNSKDAKELVGSFDNKTLLLSELAIMINESNAEATEDLDIDQAELHNVDPDIAEDIISNLKGNENIEDITDGIRLKVANATEEFINKNIQDKMEIEDIMDRTKENIDSTRTGDPELDEEIKQEHTMLAKSKVKALNNRPRSTFEQMVINMTESVLSNAEAKLEFTTENGKLDMDKIISRTTSQYTFLEMLNTLKIQDVSEDLNKLLIV